MTDRDVIVAENVADLIGKGVAPVEVPMALGTTAAALAKVLMRAGSQHAASFHTLAGQDYRRRALQRSGELLMDVRDRDLVRTRHKR